MEKAAKKHYELIEKIKSWNYAKKGYMQAVNIGFIFKAVTKYPNVAKYKMYGSYDYIPIYFNSSTE